MKSKILILVEGAKTEPPLMRHLLDVYHIGDNHEIVSYNTNIYVLYNEMFLEGDPDSIDLLRLLREREPDLEKKKIFDTHYSDILLIFDLDPQDPQFHPDKLIEMMEYFVESSDMGKLYLNYPMVEAFYHMKSIPDKDYYTYTATLREVRKKKKEDGYKKRVERECRDSDFKNFAIDKAECNTVILQNIEKAFMLIKADSPNPMQISLPKAIDILNAQVSLLEAEQKISVLCTCVFYIADYNPNLLL